MGAPPRLLSTLLPLPTPTRLHSTIVSPPVSPAEKTWIQRVVGSLLFYARGLDLSILTAVCQLSSYQSNPTQLVLTATHRLLNYVSSHPNPYKTIHPSSMALWACTNASYLSRPKSGSVTGCSVGLGDPPHYLLNPPPRKSKTKYKRITVPCPSLPPHPIPPFSPITFPHHPQCTPPRLLQAHTRGSCVCGRGGVCRGLWWWARVG